METIDDIPISKIRRASKLLKTGAKVGVNYLKYYGDKLFVDEKTAKDTLNSKNAEDIYNSLKKLKGSALKVAQMLSLDQSILPQAYIDKFSLAQFSVPPLSAPLVIKTFKKYFGKSPNEIFDTFNPKSIRAASIGQVHEATKNKKKLAVKIQYPGVAESISSDLTLIKPIATQMFNIKGKESEKYFKEVEEKLIEETDYILEAKQSIELSNACKHIPKIKFPTYHQNLSNERIITMEWMTGIQISQFSKTNKDQALANKIGQTLWDFYMYQIHNLKKVHADPHPGNFLISKEEELIVLDFGCVKVIPDNFYKPYFKILEKKNIENKSYLEKKFYELEILKNTDTKEEYLFFFTLFNEALTLLTKPFHQNKFDFSDKEYFKKISKMGLALTQNNDIRKFNNSRGSKHFIYINRIFFGIYNILHMLKCNEIKAKF